MNDAATKEQVLTVGLDLGDRYIQVCILDEAGEIIEESIPPAQQTSSTQEALNRPGFTGDSIA